MVDAYNDIDSERAKPRNSRSIRRIETKKRTDDYESGDDQAYTSEKKSYQRKQTRAVRDGGDVKGVRPSRDIKEGKVVIKTSGFRGGRLDSTASKIKMRRGMKVEEIDRDEFLEL